MKAKSTRNRRSRKFPLSKHPRGLWCKRYRLAGTKIWKMVYFQRLADDPDGKASLDEWVRIKDALQAGKPRPPVDEAGNDDRLTLMELCNRFLTRKKEKLDSGGITLRHYNDYHATTDRLIRVLGKNAIVEEILPTDFARLAADIKKTRGAVAFNNERTRVVSVFKFAWDDRRETGLRTPVDYGTGFDRSEKKLLRQARNRRAARMFEAEEVRQLIDGAGVHLRAMILLGCNGGFGNSDCEQLPIEAVDLRAGWVRFPRPKTEVPRAFPLWPETIQALQASFEQRPSPKSEADAGLFFITKYGNSWHKAKERGPVVLQFRRLLDELGLHKAGRGFYALRHAFETIGGESKDQAAVDSIMGHVRDDMASHYRERISDDRLRAVVNTVRNWLFPVAGLQAPEATVATVQGPEAGDKRPRLRVVGE